LSGVASWHISKPRRERKLSSRPSNRAALRSVDEATGRHEAREGELWSTGALEHQSARAPVDEKRFRSRIETDMVRGRIPIQKAKRFKLFCAINEIEIQDALEEAIDDLLEKYRKFSGALEHQSTTIKDDFDDLNDDAQNTLSNPSSSQSPDSGAPEHQPVEASVENKHRTAQTALEFYARKTGNQVKQRDYDSFLKVASLPEHAIRGGVLKSIILCKTRVNSFEYCVGAIQEIAETGVGEDFVQYLESKLRAKQRGLPAVSAEVKEIGK
jgi:hypothetical protein